MVGSVFLFIVACAALLGSPGPGIAALIAVGRAQGLTGGIGFFVAMQIGLALAAGLSALGLAGFLHAAPALRTMLSVASVLYLVWLAWQIASQPVSGGADGRAGGRPAGIAMGFALGFANPKAYLAFVSLFGSFVVLEPAFATADTIAKWALCVAVMVVVDLGWMATGAALGRITLSPPAERAMNIGMALMILAACSLSFL